MIAVWSNSDSWDNNMTNSSGQRTGFDYGFKEKVQKGNFSTTINLPKGVYLISILLDKNLNNICNKKKLKYGTVQY